ncbi:ECF RNA polymerase sigma factor SigK [Streptomyces sp. NPDC007325]|uniref:ECF RNA polymerase sigma factor SigK n=1 Tax=Streptomyces sp. NPDC007325 TaxID=3154588 RepID=UPI0033C77F94
MRHGSEPDEPVDALMSRTAGGDEEAFAGVYDALVQPVMGLACRILRDAAQAEEVTQEVMIEVWRTAGRFRPDRGSAKAWVLTLTHRRAVDRVRSAQARTEREQRAAVLAADRAFDQVAEAVEGDDERRRVYRCLASLARLQRVPLTLAYYQGMTYVEVARSLSTPEGTVKSRMRTGLEQLRRCLEADS